MCWCKALGAVWSAGRLRPPIAARAPLLRGFGWIWLLCVGVPPQGDCFLVDVLAQGAWRCLVGRQASPANRGEGAAPTGLRLDLAALCRSLAPGAIVFEEGRLSCRTNF